MKTSAPASTTAYLRSLESKIGTVRAKRTSVKMITGIGNSLAVLVGAITAETLLDKLVELPWIARAFILLATLAGAGWLLWRDTIQPFLKRPSDDAIALMIEHALPIFRTRFIASIQLSRVYKGDSQPVLVKALLAETASTVLRANFGRVISTKKMARAFKIAALLVVLASGLAWYGGGASVILIKRAFLFNVHLPRNTNILSVSGDQKIGIGEDCKINVTASGVMPVKGTVVATMPNGQIREFDLTPNQEGHGHYGAIIRSPQESFTYHVKLNDDTSQTYHVTTMQRPAVVKMSCQQIYPPYVKLPPVERKAGDLTLLAGSRLKVSAKASMPVKKAAIHLAGLEKDVPMRIDEKNQVDVSGEFQIPADTLTGFSIQLVSTDGVASGEAATYRIDIVPDRAPSIKILRPTRREELAVPKAEFLIAFEAKDDFGIAKAELHYTVDQGPEKTIPFEIAAVTETTVKRHFDWNFEKLPTPLILGNVIEFWITVTDTNTVTGPGVGTTEHYQIKIVTSEEKKAQLDNLRHDEMNNIRDITRNQDDLTNQIGEPLFAKPIK